MKNYSSDRAPRTIPSEEKSLTHYGNSFRSTTSESSVFCGPQIQNTDRIFEVNQKIQISRSYNISRKFYSQKSIDDLDNLWEFEDGEELDRLKYADIKA